MPTEDGARLRPPYAALGVAGVVVATVFAAVAAVAANPAEQARPAPERPGPTVPVTATSTTVALTTVPVPASTNALVTSTTEKPTTTTTTRKTTTTTTTTSQQQAPPPPPPPAPKQKPVARFTVNCTDLTCAFDGGGSFDPDGNVIFYAWSFGDGDGVDGSRTIRPSHTYPQPKLYSVTLLVMDNDGQTSSVSKAVQVGSPSG